MGCRQFDESWKDYDFCHCFTFLETLAGNIRQRNNVKKAQRFKKSVLVLIIAWTRGQFGKYCSRSAERCEIIVKKSIHFSADWEQFFPKLPKQAMHLLINRINTCKHNLQPSKLLKFISEVSLLSNLFI